MFFLCKKNQKKVQRQAGSRGLTHLPDVTRDMDSFHLSSSLSWLPPLKPHLGISLVTATPTIKFMFQAARKKGQGQKSCQAESAPFIEFSQELLPKLPFTLHWLPLVIIRPIHLVAYKGTLPHLHYKEDFATKKEEDG